MNATMTADPASMTKPCDTCDGTGYDDAWKSTCGVCWGTGVVTTDKISAADRFRGEAAGAPQAPRQHGNGTGTGHGRVKPQLPHDMLELVLWAETTQDATLLDIAKRARQYGSLTPGQARLISARRAATQPRPQARPTAPTTPAQPVPHVHEGRYALRRSDGTVGFFVVQCPTEGKWAGYTFVKRQISDNVTPVRGDAAARVLRAIAKDPQAAMLLYGQELGHCGHCGRALTNEDSRRDGIGPICARKMGW